MFMNMKQLFYNQSMVQRIGIATFRYLCERSTKINMHNCTFLVGFNKKKI